MTTTSVTQLMDEFFRIVNTTPTEDAHTAIVRHAGLTDHILALKALALLLTIEHTRRRHAEARLTEAKLMLAEVQ